MYYKFQFSLRKHNLRELLYEVLSIMSHGSGERFKNHCGDGDVISRAWQDGLKKIIATL